MSPTLSLVRPLILPFLRRDPGEIAVRAKSFRIDSDAQREMVHRLGQAFIGGYNAMLDLPGTDEVASRGDEVDPHFRPFYFEGAAMGYLARSMVSGRFKPERAESELLAMRPGFRYLYYVGLGFWYGFRHRGRPESVLRLAPHIDPMYFPLCYDGYGFKLAFFDFPDRPAVVELLARCPTEHRAMIYQGFGRALFFVYMDDPRGFDELRASLPAEHHDDLEIGRSLACGFTGTDRPDALAEWIAGAATERDRASRLTGITWALTARQMNDPAYFKSCMSRAAGGNRALLEALPPICERELEQATSYADWQTRTCAAVLRQW